MYFFRFGNVTIAGAFATDWEGMAPTLLGLIFVLASVFVPYSIVLQEALVREIIMTLRELVPMGSNGKRIRKSGGDPNQEEDRVKVDSHIVCRTGSRVTHGVCPACIKAAYGEG